MLAQQLFNGLITGGVYALFALGFTLVFGIHHLMNLAHGAIFMTGAFVALYAVLAGLPLWVGFLFAIIVCGAISVLIEITAFRRLRHSGEAEFSAIISTLGAGLIITTFAQKISGSEVLRFPFGAIPIHIFQIAGVRVSILQLTMAACAFILMLLLSYYIYRTPLGTRVRSLSSSERASVLCGVNPNVVYFQTFFLSGALAGASGVLVGLAFNSIQFGMGEPFLLRGFVVIVLGGMGSIPGAMIAGLILGIAQTLCTAYLPGGLTDAIIFSFLFVIMLARPYGLLGRETAGAMRSQR